MYAFLLLLLLLRKMRAIACFPCKSQTALLTVRSVTQSPEGPANSFPHAPILLATHQTELNMDALQHVVGGRAGRDMAEIRVYTKYGTVHTREGPPQSQLTEHTHIL